MRARVALLALCLLGSAGAVLYRAYDIQVMRGPDLREMAKEQYLKDVHLAPKRGSIYDRNGAELAISVDVDSVYANPTRLRAEGQDPRAAAERLSSLLGVDRASLTERLQSDKRFVWVKRRVTPKESRAIELLALPGVELTREPRRFYPNRELAAHVLGFANIDGRGVEGLELRLNDQLHGSNERVPAVRDRRGVVVFSNQLLDERAARGDDVTLTIDKTIQHVAERELELAVRTFEAKAGSVVAMDPRTGEVLAMANFPTFNPNAPGDAPASHRRNRAVTDRFEPGSTLKPFTIAGALSAGVVRANERIDCEHGAIKVAEHMIHDTHQWDVLSLGEVLEYSSNIGAAKVGLALGRARLYRTLRDFGFGSETALDLPGETGGILRHYKRWYEMDAATIAFGQGMSVTALQLTAAMGALANRGRMMQPVIVQHIEDASGQTVAEAVPQLERQVVSPYVASVLTDMMVAVTGEDGTGSEAAIDGQLVAGKTGTAQKADYIHGGYADGKWVASFVGFAPARAPRIVVSVIVDEPEIAHQGGVVAAPAFRRIVSASLRHLGVLGSEPTQGQELQARKKARAAERRANAAQAANPGTTTASEGGSETDTQAVAEAPVPLRAGQRRVPSLIGLTARAAIVRSQQSDLVLTLRGSGVVRSQQPAPQQAVAAGSTISAVLAPLAAAAPADDGAKRAGAPAATTPPPASRSGEERASKPVPVAAPQARATVAQESAVEGRDG